MGSNLYEFEVWIEAMHVLQMYFVHGSLSYDILATWSAIILEDISISCTTALRCIRILESLITLWRYAQG